MNKSSFLIFFAVFLTVYGSLNFYIFRRGWQALPRIRYLRESYSVIFLLLAVSFIAGRFGGHYFDIPFSEALVWTGSVWLGFMLYLVLFLAALDLVRYADRLVHFLPAFITANYTRAKGVAFVTLLAAAAVVVAAGYYNAVHPVWRELVIDLPGKAGKLKKLDLVMVSDIHLGTLIKNSRLDQLVAEINSRQPDAVLLAGDIIDEDLRPVAANGLGYGLEKIRSRYGIYAVNGNHEFIGGADAAEKYLSAHGINMLRDRVVLVAGAFYIAGREDRSINRLGAGRRMALPELMKGVNLDLPVILMDHQPFDLHEAAEAGVDLQVSGHTHHGQMWPLNYIVDLIYQIPYGPGKIGDTSFYISNGYGTWGPPVRTGNRPEIVHIKLRF